MLKLTTSLIISCLMLGVTAVSANDAYKEAWEKAESRRLEAAAVQYEWRDTKEMLEKAQAAADEGDMEKAMKLVAQAQEQSDDAIIQQTREAELWQARVPQ